MNQLDHLALVIAITVCKDILKLIAKIDFSNQTDLCTSVQVCLVSTTILIIIILKNLKYCDCNYWRYADQLIGLIHDIKFRVQWSPSVHSAQSAVQCRGEYGNRGTRQQNSTNEIIARIQGNYLIGWMLFTYSCIILFCRANENDRMCSLDKSPVTFTNLKWNS